VRRSTIGILTWSVVATLGLLFAVAAFAAPRASAAGVPYAVGDVFAGQSGDVIKHFNSTGLLLDTLHTTLNTETGMCFGEMGRLRATNFGSNNMTMFDNMGTVIPPNPWTSGFNSHPESCVLDASGAIYVGTADGLKDIYKFDTSGNLLAQYNPTVGPRGTDWIDLASDQ
jgi:outer membrane protein assembly factor BamB